ncbi:MAG: BREX system P-loop protein BrxC, partial [Salinibacter sp.]
AVTGTPGTGKTTATDLLDDPVIHVFVPKAGAQDLSSRIREAEAARRALDIKGHPAGDEGKEARRSMESRLQRLEAERDELIRDVIRSARVYQGGGHEIHGDLLETKIQEAAEDSLSRLFPQFEEGDHRSWETALKRARDGSDHPLTAVDWDRDTEEHPVVRQVLSQIGDHTKGNEIRKTLRAPPFGWPQDAIDAALISLHSSGVVRAEQNGEPIAVGGLDQNKISSAVFQRERVRLGTSEKLAIRGLYERVGVRARSGEEALKAGEFLGAVRQLAQDAGGDPPLPEPPSTAKIDELRQLSGNDQLAAIHEAKDELESCVEEWQELKERREERLPQWDRLQKMLEHAEGLPVAEEVRPDVEAIRDGLSLLDETDYLTSLRQTLEDGLRRALKEAHDDCEQVFQQELSSLHNTEAWQRLDEESQREILRAHRIEGIDEIDVSDEESLMAALAHRGIQGWRELAEALPTRFAQAREKMARAQEPSTHTVKLQSHILNSEEDVDEWVQQTRDRLLKELENGPIVIN